MTKNNAVSLYLGRCEDGDISADILIKLKKYFVGNLLFLMIYLYLLSVDKRRWGLTV